MTLKKGDNTLKKSTIFLEILRCIPEKRYITRREIGQELKKAGIKVQTRTLQRYLDRISSTETFQIELDARSRPYGYKKLSKLNSIEPQKMGPADYLLLKLAQEHLNYQMPTKLVSGLKPLFDQAAHYMSDLDGSTERNWLKKVICVPNALVFEPPKIRPSVFAAVSEALFRGLLLQIQYEVDDGRDQKTVSVIPLGLVQQDVRTYLVYKEASRVECLALNRIEAAEVLQEKATAPSGFDLKAYVKRDERFNEGATRWVKVSFEFTNPETCRMLKETPFLGKSQKIQKISKKKWKCTAVVRDSSLLDGWFAVHKEQAGISNVKREAVKGR